MNRAELIQQLKTIAAIPVTPFHPDGSIDWDIYGAVVRRIVDGGVTVVTPNGNTGEFYALSREECDRAVEVTSQALSGRGDGVLIMPGVGYDVATAVALGKAAQ